MLYGKETNRRGFLKNLGLMGATGVGSLILGGRAIAAKDIYGGQEIFTVEDIEKGGTLNFMCWGGYDSNMILNPFRKKYNCTINVELLNTEPEAVMKLKAGAKNQFHVLNFNGMYCLVAWEAGLIKELDNDTFVPYFNKLSKRYQWPYKPAMSPNGKVIGLPTRVGTFGMVVNTDKISKKTAQEEAYKITLDPKNKGKFGLLLWDKTVIIHACNAAEITPYKKHTDEEKEKIFGVMKYWFENAKIATPNNVQLTNALISGEIDFHVPGGVYTASRARLAGHWNIVAITPRKRSNGGIGGERFLELIMAVNNPKQTPLADDFLAYMQTKKVAYHVATGSGEYSLNAVVQMNDPEFLSLFTKDELRAIQYDDLEEDLDNAQEHAAIPDYDEMTKLYRKAKALR